MRIIAGRHKGRPLTAPKGLAVRPTSDRAREALFNILMHGPAAAQASPVTGARVLDAFCGTGALALEALSRGAAHAVLMDDSARALKAARANAERLGEGERVTPVRADATRPPPAHLPPSDLVFLDPPYGSGLGPPALRALAERGWLGEHALAVVEVAAREPFAAPEGFETLVERTSGAARIVILRREETSPPRHQGHQG